MISSYTLLGMWLIIQSGLKLVNGALGALLWVFICISQSHDDVIKWKHFRRNWPFVRKFIGPRWIPRTNGQWRGALVFSLTCVWINVWVNNGEAGVSRRHRTHYDVIVMHTVCLVPRKPHKKAWLDCITWIQRRDWQCNYNKTIPNITVHSSATYCMPLTCPMKLCYKCVDDVYMLTTLPSSMPMRLLPTT